MKFLRWGVILEFMNTPTPNWNVEKIRQKFRLWCLTYCVSIDFFLNLRTFLEDNIIDLTNIHFCLCIFTPSMRLPSVTVGWDYLSCISTPIVLSRFSNSKFKVSVTRVTAEKDDTSKVLKHSFILFDDRCVRALFSHIVQCWFGTEIIYTNSFSHLFG